MRRAARGWWAVLVVAGITSGCQGGPRTALRDALAWLRGDEPCVMADPGSPEARAPEPGAEERVVALRKKAWEAARGGEAAAKPYIQARLAGWPSRVRAEPREIPRTDREYLARLARDTWRGLDALRDSENGLPLDHVRFGRTSTALADSWIGDYTNVTNVGLHLTAIVAAHELKLLSEADAVARIRQVLDTLDRLERHAGFFFNFYDTTSEERTSNFISFVDSAWLTAGLIVVRNTFPALREPCTRWIARQDYAFFYDAGRGLMSHGYFVQRRRRSRFHYGLLYAESRLGSLLAIGTGAVPAAHWFGMIRTFPAACTWQSQTPHGRKPKTVLGHRLRGGFYEWDGTRYVPSWGGSMFEALMPALFLDERRYAPHSLGANGVAHAVVQRRYAVETLGLPVWGMSPSAAVPGDGYGEFGVPVLGAASYRPGPVTPHAAALALGVTPDAAVANLRRLVDLYDMYGEYGLYDAVDPHTGTVAHKYLALDQSMILIALANHLADGAVQKRFAADPVVQRVLPVIDAENFFD